MLPPRSVFWPQPYPECDLELDERYEVRPSLSVQHVEDGGVAQVCLFGDLANAAAIQRGLEVGRDLLGVVDGRWSLDVAMWPFALREVVAGRTFEATTSGHEVTVGATGRRAEHRLQCRTFYRTVTNVRSTTGVSGEVAA